jgi:hypothetical protein
MFNSLGTLSPEIVALRVLSFLKKKFPMIANFATDFSDEPILFNQTVIARVVVPGGDPQDYDPASGTGTGYTNPDAADTTDVDVTINKHKYARVDFDDQVITSTNRNLVDEQMKAAAYRLGRGLLKDLFSAVTIGNFPTAVTETIANTDRSTLGKLRKQLTNQGAGFPRFGVINPDAFENLADDSRILNQNFRNDMPDFEGGIISNVNGFQNIYEWADLPTTGAMSGFFTNPAGLVIATRVPKDPGTLIGDGLPIPGKILIVKDTDTNLGLMVRYSYNMDTGKLSMVLTWMYGFAVGVAGQGTLLKTA